MEEALSHKRKSRRNIHNQRKQSNYVCVRHEGQVKRLHRDIAAALVAKGAEYVPRHVWKEEVRDVAPEATPKPSKKSKGNPKGKARKQR